MLVQIPQEGCKAFPRMGKKDPQQMNGPENQINISFAFNLHKNAALQLAFSDEM